jgi:predicted nucleotidyltransferase component of viral defense system
VIFFGGTALARSHLPAGRLSEDIDLIATGARRETAAAIEQTLERALRRSRGRISWAPGLTAVRDTDAAVLLGDEGRLRCGCNCSIASATRRGRPSCTRSSSAIRTPGPARLRVPTAASFAAWKTVAWHDRRAPRHLWDLWALAQHDELIKRAAELFVAHGPIGNTPQPRMFTSPDRERWRAQLAGQIRLTVSAAEALQVVADAWARASTEIIS